MKDRLIRFALLAAGALVLAGTGLKVFHNLPQYKDLILWDEAFYMFRGLTFFERIPREWGPAYCLHYLILFLFNRDTIDLYYFNYKLLAIAGPVLAYIFLVRKHVHPVAAAALAAFFLFSSINILSWPYVSHFCVAILFAGMIAATFARSAFNQWVVFCGTALLLSYARPEYYLAFLVLTVILLFKLAKLRLRITRPEFFALLFLVLAVIASHAALGFSLSGGGAVFGAGQFNRQVFAFGNHYAINYGRWHGIEHAWLMWEIIFRQHFTPTDSFFTTISSNWPEFFRHVGSNIVHFMKYSLQLWSDVLVPGEFIPRRNAWNILIWTLAAGVFLAAGRARSVMIMRQYVSNALKDRMLAALVILTVPALMSSILLYPRDHYMILQAPLVLYAAGLFFRQRDENSLWKNRDLAVGLAVGMLLFFLAPSGGRLDHYSEWNRRSEPHNLMAVKALRQIEVEEPCRLLEDEGGLSLFVMNPAITSVFPTDVRTGASMADYIQKNDVKLIFVSYMLDTDPNLKDDALWETLKSDPGSFSFRRQDIPGTDTYLLIHESIWK